MSEELFGKGKIKRVPI